jgi:hypothetical protein
MGKPADRATRKVRRAAHSAFDPLWNTAEPRFIRQGGLHPTA